MAQVTVTFTMEGDGPDHESGVTEDTYNKVVEAVMQVGGEDVDIQQK